MNKNGEFQIEVLPDGMLRVTTPGAFSPQTHKSADEFMATLQELTGGTVVEHKDLTPQHLKKAGQVHTHADGTTHSH